MNNISSGGITMNREVMETWRIVIDMEYQILNFGSGETIEMEILVVNENVANMRLNEWVWVW